MVPLLPHALVITMIAELSEAAMSDPTPILKRVAEALGLDGLFSGLFNFKSRGKRAEKRQVQTPDRIQAKIDMLQGRAEEREARKKRAECTERSYSYTYQDDEGLEDVSVAVHSPTPSPMASPPVHAELIPPKKGVHSPAPSHSWRRHGLKCGDEVEIKRVISPRERTAVGKYVWSGPQEDRRGCRGKVISLTRELDLYTIGFKRGDAVTFHESWIERKVPAIFAPDRWAEILGGPPGPDPVKVVDAERLNAEICAATGLPPHMVAQRRVDGMRNANAESYSKMDPRPKKPRKFADVVRAVNPHLTESFGPG